MHDAPIDIFDGDLDRRDTTQLIAGIVIATLMVLVIVIADLASGDRPDPPTLRAAATLLDGSWRFAAWGVPTWNGSSRNSTVFSPVLLTFA